MNEIDKIITAQELYFNNMTVKMTEIFETQKMVDKIIRIHTAEQC